jgi:hypothetical protein
MKTPEGRVKDAIRKWLRGEDVYIFSPVQTGYGSRTLDLLICWCGRFVAIEVKRPGGKATKLQEQIMEDIIAAGGIAFCTDSLDDCQQAIHAYFGD